MHAKLLQLCPTLCDPMDYSPPGSSVHGDSPGKNTEVGCHALLHGIFPTQGSNISLFMFPVLAGGFFTTTAAWEAQYQEHYFQLKNPPANAGDTGLIPGVGKYCTLRSN